MTTFMEVGITTALAYGGINYTLVNYRHIGPEYGNASLDAAIEWLGDPSDKPSEAQIIIWWEELVAQTTANDTVRETNQLRIEDIETNGGAKEDFDDMFNTLELLRNYSSSVPSIGAAFTTLRSRISKRPGYLELADNFVEGIFNVTLPADPETASNADKRTWVHGAWLVVLTLSLESSISVARAG